MVLVDIAVGRLALLVRGRLFQENSSHKGRGGGQQPFDAPHLDGLKIDEVLRLVDEAYADRPGHAAKADEEGDQRSGGKADPALDLVEMQVLNPGREGDPAPADSRGGGTELGGSLDQKIGRQEIG